MREITPNIARAFVHSPHAARVVVAVERRPDGSTVTRYFLAGVPK